jgi:eukaryotic-like serine/threonine-protein kinase
MIGPHELGDIVVSRYRIDGFVGEGGMQYVYCAYDQLLGRTVALKTPKNSSAEKRFRRSAIVSAKVNHPNVAKTLDYAEEFDRFYLVEELIDGDDLEGALLKHVEYLDPFLIARVLHYLAKGLAASHHVGVIHRDLKPTNIMIEGGFQVGAIKITDFGIAKMAEEEMTEAAEGGTGTLSTSATAVGALPYMAPEAIETPKEVGLKADIWSLGAMTYELLTGNKPFGSGLRAVSKILSVDYPDFPPFVTSNPQFRYLSSELISIVESCLKLDPVERPSADEIVEKCSKLCYPISERFFGNISEIRYNSFGYIRLEDASRVFYHVNCVYGDRPAIGERVLLSKYQGEGSDRALPVIKVKQQ